MSELKFKQSWNGMLSVALALMVVLMLSMAWQISRMVLGDVELSSPHSLVFIIFFMGVSISLVGLKMNPRFFSFLGILSCFGVVVHILLVVGLFSVESLIASVALIFLVLGNRKLGADFS